MPLRFVSCGVDGKIILWISNNNNIENFNSQIIFSYEHAIKCISWLNYIGYANETIAFGTDDGFVKILKFKIGKWICSSTCINLYADLALQPSSTAVFLYTSLRDIEAFIL